MNTMISLAPRAEQETPWFTTQRVINRMEAAASAINAVIGKDGSTLDPFLQQSIVMPIPNILLAGTGCPHPFYLERAETMGAATGRDVLLLRFDADKGTTFDVRFHDADRWLCRFVAWRRCDGDLWLIPSAGSGLYIRASYKGLEPVTTPPFVSEEERKAGIILAIETPSFDGSI